MSIESAAQTITGPSPMGLPTGTEEGAVTALWWRGRSPTPAPTSLLAEAADADPRQMPLP